MGRRAENRFGEREIKDGQTAIGHRLGKPEAPDGYSTVGRKPEKEV